MTSPLVEAAILVGKFFLLAYGYVGFGILTLALAHKVDYEPSSDIGTALMMLMAIYLWIPAVIVVGSLLEEAEHAWPGMTEQIERRFDLHHEEPEVSD